MNTLLAPTMPRKGSAAKIMLLILNLPMVVYVYTNGLSLAMLFMSDEIWLKVIGLAGSAITTTAALLKYVHEVRRARQQKRTEEENARLRLEVERLREEASLRASKQDAFEADRAAFRAQVIARLEACEKKVEGGQ